MNIDNSTNINIRNNWSTVVRNPRPGFVTTLPASRRTHWNYWGNNVRRHWSYGRYHHSFNDIWWSNHHHGLGGWHYYHNHPWYFWWQRPTWTNTVTWFAWPATYSTVWRQPVFYDFGPGGNVVFRDNRVYIGGEMIATTEQFAMSAADLATVPPPESWEIADQAEWMPLGTFALSTGEHDVDPTMLLQLAVDRQGIVSGTMFNTETDLAQTIQGRVDPETQRVAFRIGESDGVVAETGLYNLTQDESPLLIHFGPDDSEVYLLIRLEEPQRD